MDHEEDALDPAFALLDKVPEGEWGLLPHFALNEVKAVAFAKGFHCKEAVFSDRTVKAVVEGNFAFGANLKQNNLVNLGRTKKTIHELVPTENDASSTKTEEF